MLDVNNKQKHKLDGELDCLNYFCLVFLDPKLMVQHRRFLLHNYRLGIQTILEIKFITNPVSSEMGL